MGKRNVKQNYNLLVQKNYNDAQSQHCYAKILWQQNFILNLLEVMRKGTDKSDITLVKENPGAEYK